MKRGSLRRLYPFVLAGIVGCAPAWYRDSADLQVSDLLRDRKQQTLGYTPEVEVATGIPAKPTKAAYARIPATPIPPPTTAPIERQEVDFRPVPLGPDVYWMDAPPDSLEAPTELMGRRLGFGEFFGPPVPDDMYPRLDLFGLLAYAVQNGRTYQDQMDQLYLSALGVTLERHLLSPRPFVRQSVQYTGGQANVDYRSAMTATTSAGVRQKLPYGGEIVAQTLVDFVQALTDNATSGESASVVLSGSLPLLRGAGMVNLEGLISSERELIYQVRNFEEYRRSFVVAIASQYFNLLEQQQGLVNRRLNLASYQLLTERAEAMYDARRLIFLEVQRALQNRLRAENELINAEEAYQSALDAFKLTIGMPVNERLEVIAIQLDLELPKTTAEDAVTLAQKYRLDLRTAADRIEDANRSVQIARNSLLPSLDLTAQGRVTNEPDEAASQLNDDTATYSAGATLDLPVDRLAERNVYRRALIAWQRAQRNFVAERDRIIAQVRESVRAIRAAEMTYAIQRQGIDLAQKRVELANELLKQGKGNTRDVVEAQSSLLEAQDSFERARSRLQIRALEYMRATGTLRVDPGSGSLGKAMDRSILLPEGLTIRANNGDGPRYEDGKVNQ